MCVCVCVCVCALQTDIWKKINKKRRLKTSVLLENNQLEPQCLAKRKKKTPIELSKLIHKSAQYTNLVKTRITKNCQLRFHQMDFLRSVSSWSNG